MTCKEYGNIRLWQGDCMDLMADKPEDHWDLAIVDPPYGIGESSKNFASRSNLASADKYTPKKWDNDKPSDEYFLDLFSVSSNQIVWGGNHLVGKTTSCMIVWDKDNGKNDFADCELAWTSFNSAVRKIKWRWNGMLQENMKNKEHRIHPTQKPTPIYRWLLNNYANEADRILDTHGGSMSLAIACYMEGFELDIIELDEDYYNAAVKRFENHISQKVLF